MAACVAACANGVLDCGLVSQRSAVSGGVRRSGVVSLVNRGGVLVRRKGLGIGGQKLQGVRRWSAVSGRAKVVLEEVDVDVDAKASPVEQTQNGNGGSTNGAAMKSSSPSNGTEVRASNGAAPDTGNGSVMENNNGSVPTNGAVNGLPTNGAANSKLDSIGQEDPWFKNAKEVKASSIRPSLCLPTSRRIR